ncbi:hypothetical protein E4U17_005296 [Claviceps sp. LM77 group G4]|nr:hypothetical protein E4U17_005296 [Claviceps sp. LM77 group G4]KAG6058166.1 hypothetical protein E4U33_007303 [Claviceps sp. LM78 group G4]KAG6073927.1 hypothetical protein E4U16_004330 [Claviceps sp. LM84 group G4]
MQRQTDELQFISYKNCNYYLFQRACSSFKILNTPSKTSSTTHASTTTLAGVTTASPAAYTLITPSLPPSYVVPDLEEYGYGNPPPAYGFSKAASDVSSSTGSRSVTSSRSSITSSARLSRTTSEPAVYGSSTSMTTMTQMTRLASLQVDSDPSNDSVENADVVKVTLISSIAGEYHTTVVTIQQAGAAASTDAPSGLALSDASNEGSSEDQSSFVDPNAESGEDTAFGTETPMPAVFVAAGVNSRPNELAMILAGCVVSIFYWAL